MTRERKPNRRAPEPPPLASFNDIFLERGLPSNLEAERSILGAVILDNRIIAQAASMLKPHDFFIRSNRLIFECMLILGEYGMPIDWVSLGDELRRSGDYEQVGGGTYIASLIDGVPRTDTIEHYAKILRAHTIMRDSITESNRFLTACFERAGEPSALLTEHETAMRRIASGQTLSKAEPVGDGAERYLEQVERIAASPRRLLGYSTGFNDLDAKTHGLRKNRLVVIAARPNVGKTALLGNLFTALGDQGGVGLIFSFEMSADELIGRALASLSGVDLGRIETGYLNRAEWSALADAGRKLGGMRIFIDYCPGIDIAELKARARRFKMEQGALDAFGVDYLQLCHGTAKYRGREQEVSEVARGLKELTGELDTAGIATAQLSREPEKRSDHKPGLADLRESGEIEQAADLVAFLYRDEMYGQTDANRGVAELLIKKQRGGWPRFDVPLVYRSECTRFLPMFREPDSQAATRVAVYRQDAAESEAIEIDADEVSDVTDNQSY